MTVTTYTAWQPPVLEHHCCQYTTMHAPHDYPKAAAFVHDVTVLAGVTADESAFV